MEAKLNPYKRRLPVSAKAGREDESYFARFRVLLLAALLAGCGSGGGGDTSPPTPITVVAAGDIAACGTLPASQSKAAQTAALVTAQDALVLTLGDNAYEDGTLAEFTDCFHPTWGAFKDRIRPSPGNHDYHIEGADGYFTYFGSLAGPDRRGYYSFDAGGWHFISLNSQIDASTGSPQYAWLAADLENSRNALCTIAYWHYPVFSSGRNGSVVQMTKIFEALHAAGVDIVLNGHDHTYERFAPQTSTGSLDPDRGIREFVVGTGGSPLYQFVTIRANSEVRDNTSHGVLRLTLHTDRYEWAFMPVGGGPARDPGEGACHR